MMNILIIGCGYVGLATGAALAYIGHEVTFLDVDKEKINNLRKGIMPLHERYLKEILQTSRSHITFFDNWDHAPISQDVVMIAVGTPSKENGDADLSFVEEVAREIGRRLEYGVQPVIINKSTVPVGSAQRVKSLIENELKITGIQTDVLVASNPEFLREGTALQDTFYPDRIIIGTESQDALHVLQKMYQPILEQTFMPPKELPRPKNYVSPAWIATDPTSAELIKYAANSFLAMKISFINEFANLADQVGADISVIAKGIGLDPRIGSRFLQAGIGWGGSCFGKDARAIVYTGRQYNCEMQLVQAAIDVNQRQREVVIQKLISILHILRGKTIGILGLAYKPNTDDLRDAPSIEIIQNLLALGAYVKVHDPVANKRCQNQYPDLQVEYNESVNQLFEGCHAVVLVTEWNEFLHLPFEKLGRSMKERIIIDGRNVLNPATLKKAGFIYFGVGRRGGSDTNHFIQSKEVVMLQ